MAIKDDMENVQETVINELITENGITNTLDDNQVTETKILNGAVTPAKLSQAYLPLTGGSVSGTVTADGLIIEDGGSATNSLDITYSGSSGQANIQVDSDGGNTFLTFGTSQSGTVAERMRIDSSGNLAVGTISTGDGKLCINGGANNSSILSGRSDGGNGNNGRFKITAFADGGGANYGGGIGFHTRSTTNVFSEAMRIDSQGHIILSHVPTSASGLTTGTIYSDGGTLKIKT
jgi:hypothetical protein